jgi:hypothetical protein
MIMDLGNMSTGSIPRKTLQEVMSKLVDNYVSRLERLFIVYSNKTIRAIWAVVRFMLEKVTRNKITFHSDGAV